MNHTLQRNVLNLMLHLQVSSAVPEGKGVSSSAAIEVASMSAIAAAHGDFSNLVLCLSCICLPPRLKSSTFEILIFYVKLNQLAV